MKLLTAAAAITTCLLMSGNVMAQNIQIKVDGKAYAGGLNGNDAAKDFAAKLPLKLKFEDFGSTERISYLPKSLNLGSAPRSSKRRYYLLHPMGKPGGFCQRLSSV